MDDVYRRLQRHLDRMPVGFPATGSGVEIRLLQRLFSPDDAALALELSAIPEPPGVIHRRVRQRFSREALEAALEDMAARGLIERLATKRGVRYSKSMLAIGMYERQLTRLTPELQRDVEQYMAEAFGRELHKGRTPQMRSVPVNQAIPTPRHVMESDDLRRFIERSEGPFAAMECICRKGHALEGKPCRQTSVKESCLTIGIAAAGMVESGAARFVDKAEMLRLIDQADREGLVLQPQNTREPLFVCCCCGCCCGVLTSAKMLPEPARSFAANHLAVVSETLCEACGTCQGRCQMDAIRVEGDAAAVLSTRCIGCGLCVTTCPSGALSLAPVARPQVPPADMPALYSKIFAERNGKFALALAAGRYLLHRKV